MRKKILTGILAAIAVLLLASAVYFFWFSATGYRMSVPIHGFTEVAEKVYVEENWPGDVEALIAMTAEARARVGGYFGDIRSDPTLILCDDARKLRRLGGDHDTHTVMAGGAHSYISLSSEWLNVDVLAHEITHAETHARVHRGGVAFSLPIPVWFDEGLAVQNDTREQYSLAAWEEFTAQGSDIPGMGTYDTAAKFYGGQPEDRRRNYCLAAHEVSFWVEQNGKDALMTLLDQVGAGEAFAPLYFADGEPKAPDGVEEE